MLLCLRLGVGEAMAAQMLQQQLAAAQASAAQQAAMPDCPGHTSGQDAAARDAEDPACGSCLHCEACSLHALPAAQAMAPVWTAHPLPLPLPARFTSAQPLQGLKPPIS